MTPDTSTDTIGLDLGDRHHFACVLSFDAPTNAGQGQTTAVTDD